MGRPPKTSRDQIVAAAALADPTELQITSLASELGIAVKTIYNYFPNRGALLDAVRERSVSQIPLPDVPGCTTWREVLTASARWHYDVFREHTDLGNNAGAAAASVDLMQQCHARLEELGVEPHEAVRAQLLVTNWARATGESAHRTIAAGGLSPDNLHRVLDDYDRAGRFADLLADLTLEEVFTSGLSTLLAGVENDLA